ncbi:MAG: 30S ribosome-binding factor RbfA [bacterium]
MRSFDRTDRVNDQIQKILGGIIERELRDPRIGFVTITDVEASKDYSVADIYFTVGEDQDPKESLDGLQAAAGYLRKRLGEEISIRQTPELRFEYDESVDRGFRMERLLKEIAEERDEDPSTEDRDED